MKGLLFTYGMAGLGALCGLFCPFYGLLVYVSFAIIKPDAMWSWSVPPARYSLMIAVCLFTGWAFTRQATLKAGRACVPLLLLSAFLVWTYFGAYFPDNQYLAWDFVERLAKIVIPVLIGITLIRSRTELQQLAWTILLSQGYVAWELNSYYYSGYNVLRWEGFADMDNNSAAIALVTGIGIAFFVGLHAEKLWQKVLAFFLAALMVNAILFSFSRGGMLGLICTGLGAFLVIPKRPRTYALFASAVCVALALAGPEVRERFAETFAKNNGQLEASAQSRIELWKDCLDVISKHPVMGCGPNHWPMLASSYGWPHGKEAHSLWVQTAAETGLVGITMYLGFYLATLALLWHLTWTRTQVTDPWYTYTARMSFASLSGFIVSAQFVSLEALEIPYYTALLGCGALKLASLPQTRSLSDEECDDEAIEQQRDHEYSDTETFEEDLNPAASEEDEFAAWPPLPV